MEEFHSIEYNDSTTTTRTKSRGQQCLEGLVWRIYFGMANYSPYLLVLSSSIAGFFCFHELAFGCSSFVRREKIFNDNSNNGASPLYFYGLWQHYAGTEDDDRLCQSYDGESTRSSLLYKADGNSQDSWNEGLGFAKACSVIGLILSTGYLLFLTSILCIMYPQTKLCTIGGWVGIIMSTLTALVVFQGVLNGPGCNISDSSSSSPLEWFWSYGSTACSVHYPEKVIWLNVLCWCVAGMGMRWLGDSSISKSRFRGRNVANACRVAIPSPNNEKENKIDLPYGKGMHEDDDICGIPPSMGDIMLYSQQPEAMTTTYIDSVFHPTASSTEEQQSEATNHQNKLIEENCTVFPSSFSEID